MAPGQALPCEAPSEAHRGPAHAGLAIEDVTSLPLIRLGSASGRACARRHRPAQAATDRGLGVPAPRPGMEDLL